MTSRHRRAVSRRSPRRWAGVAVVGLLLAAAPAARPAAPPRGIDLLRTTVQVRNGNTRGSGTIIASRPGVTVILTAAHVVRDAAELKVELHRVNFGSTQLGLTEGNGWPRLVPAALTAADRDADVAVLTVRGMVALPFVARFNPGADEPAGGEVVTSVGIDRTLHLNLWQTRVEGSARIKLYRDSGAKRFTVTSHAPEHGRSGGGLFRNDGAVVGVCCGQLTLKAGERNGAFASMDSIRTLLREHGLLRDPAATPARRDDDGRHASPSAPG